MSNREDALRLAPDDQERAVSYDKALAESRAREERADRSDDRDTDSALKKATGVWDPVRDQVTRAEVDQMRVDIAREEQTKSAIKSADAPVYVCSHCGGHSMQPGTCHGTYTAYHDPVARVRVPSE